LSEKYYSKFKLEASGIIPIESLPLRYGRALAIDLACNSGNVHCLEDTLALVKRYVNNGQRIPNGLESILCHGMRTSGENEFVNLWHEMQMTSDTTFKRTLIEALGCNSHEELLFDYLESTLGSGNSVNYTQVERGYVFSAVLRSFNGLRAITQFITKSEASIISSYGWTLQTILTNVANSIKSRDDQYFFVQYLGSLDHVSGDVIKAVLQATARNFTPQDLPQNTRQIEIIQRIVNDWNTI
jgi:ERAP1-like C-terminal domain